MSAAAIWQAWSPPPARADTGRFIAEIPRVIEKVQADTAEMFDSQERREAQRAHFAAKRAADEHDYPYSLIPLVQRYARGGYPPPWTR